MDSVENQPQTRIQIYPTPNSGVSPFWKDKYEREAKKYWDIFYKRHQDKFFKDRHYLDKEWGRHFTGAGRKVLLEVGCGAGNTVFPLLDTYPDVFVNACDFSQRAISLVKKAAIKKIDMQATKEFLAELKVLSHVHLLNLVRLIGYCVEHSLFLIYQYTENGTLSEHLRSSGKTVLTWSTRVQIALDSARGFEYIHEHTVPVYIHRDIKSANKLLDNNFHAKVADFGLTKLAEVGNASLPTGLVGTFGYMPPEYAQFGDVSPKIDVFAFGVVLFELISAKAAIVQEDGSPLHAKSIVTLFEAALNEPDPNSICKLVDPRLGEDYPIHSVLKMAELGKACTLENPALRPSMRHVVVALNSLSSTAVDWSIGTFYEHGRLNLVSGR